jgi:hypothetical protein
MWDNNRPILDKLPEISEQWRGNAVVDWLTGFWDELLVQHKNNLTNPIDWIGTPNQIHPVYLDWVGVGLCGYGALWDQGWTTEIKRRMIGTFVTNQKYRGSLGSCRSIAQAIEPDTDVLSFSGMPRADIDLADVAVCGSDDPTHYLIMVPPWIKRNGRIWYWLERLRVQFFPVGSLFSRVQHPSLAGYSVAGDSVTGLRTYNYADLP